ncbi:gentisate 1,2-dioxygenase [Cladophialophora psammophila CBS 110553]|uniref:Gentisate 1,2-dioxygenase n=1 Tax=Cladophialophora psammophila CBS 110553 TaxID=1182543 RepID=W9WCX5_9EURO|nr:gentisate 1,2-dioxygenase [Cladophialophora psammophila CBS 110553]EXJ56369.1 gentisate 1,2-dioxygenase [Cladophialophora psammophila CBS 110553]
MSLTQTSTATLDTTVLNAAETLLQKLPEQHVQPLWTAMRAMVTPQPSRKAEVSVWRYNDLRPLLLEAGKVVTSEEAERRVLMLINPALRAPFTTDSIYAGLQLINQGETAPAHRHRAFALRFIIEGTRGFTAVEGEKVYMEAGDVILTPQWQWHDHGHEGTGPMIWLDGLDLPLYHQLPTHFAEPYEESRYPSKPAPNSALRFPWEEMKARLDADAAPWALQHYRNPSGHYISDTLGAHAEKVQAGQQSTPRRDTCSYIYHAHAGSGKTEITTATGAMKTVHWGPHDTFVVPAWSRVMHTADSEQDSYLFVLSDRPLLERLKMYSIGE